MESRFTTISSYITGLLGLIWSIAVFVWIVWCISVAFRGGILPIINYEVTGSTGYGIFWLIVLSPILLPVLTVVGVFVLMIPGFLLGYLIDKAISLLFGDRD